MKEKYVAIPPSDPRFPKGLRDIFSNITLYAVGNLDLLGQGSIGICGSRDASDEAQGWALRFGREAAKHDLLVVSGYARGVDRQAHKGVMEAGGGTIAILPEGIGNFKVRRELASLVRLENNFLALSMFEPDAVWKTWRAMERNKLIVGLSSGMFVVEARETGGTINAARECVKQGKPLWAVDYSSPTPGRVGNQLLLQDSAKPLRQLSDVRVAMGQAAESTSVEAIRQLALDLVS
jgi:DNA processing protein